MTPLRPTNWGGLRRDWPLLSYYQRFETTVALVLTFVIGVVIVVALYRLVVGVFASLLLRTLNPLEHTVFQEVFGQIMTVLIALEFNHSLQHVIGRARGIIQAKVVILIALLALARKVIVVDLSETTPASVAALGFLALSLGVVYWLMRERDDSVRRPKHGRPGISSEP